MLSKENRKKCLGVIQMYGFEHQLVKLVEEMAELQQATTKLLERVLRHENVFADDENFKEELADVYVLCQQSQFMFDVSDDEINDRASAKLDEALKEKKYAET